MSSRGNLKRRKKSKQALFACWGLLVFLLVLLIVLSLVRVFGKKEYEIDSRVDNIITEKKKDDEDLKTVGWIRVQGTNIDYPVIYAPNYEFSYKIDDFAWTEIDYGKLNNIVFVSGHNILNQSANPRITGNNHKRFEQLMSFTYYDFVKDNQFIQYTIDGKDYIYKIYAVFYDSDRELDLYNKKFYSKDEMKTYLDDVLNKSIYDFDVDVREDDYFISLVTCTKMFGDGYDDSDERGSFVVNGRLLREDEKATLSKVSKSAKYKEVEEQMKGGEVYEEA